MKSLVWILLIAAAGAYLVMNAGSSEKKKFLQEMDPQDQQWQQAVKSMTEDEIKSVYDFITQFANKNIEVPEGNPLRQSINEISKKYNIFT